MLRAIAQDYLELYARGLQGIVSESLGPAWHSWASPPTQTSQFGKHLAKNSRINLHQPKPLRHRPLASVAVAIPCPVLSNAIQCPQVDGGLALPFQRVALQPDKAKSSRPPKGHNPNCLGTEFTIRCKLSIRSEHTILLSHAHSRQCHDRSKSNK